MNDVTIRDHKLIVKFARFTCTNNEFVRRNKIPEQQRNQYGKSGADPVKERTQGTKEGKTYADVVRDEGCWFAKAKMGSSQKSPNQTKRIRR